MLHPPNLLIVIHEKILPCFPAEILLKHFSYIAFMSFHVTDHGIPPSPSTERQNKPLLQNLFSPLFPFYLIDLPKSELLVEVAGRMKSLERP